jgi:hypothetical protein
MDPLYCTFEHYVSPRLYFIHFAPLTLYGSRTIVAAIPLYLIFVFIPWLSTSQSSWNKSAQPRANSPTATRMAAAGVGTAA